MMKWTLRLGVITVLALAAYGAATKAYWPFNGTVSWDFWPFNGAVAQAPNQKNAPRAVPVEVARAEKKKGPVRIELLGTVTPMASVAVKTRIDSEITEVHFRDGVTVKQGELLFTLDSRAIEAQVRQAEGRLARDKAQLEGAQRDVRRFSELVEKGATPVTNLDNAKTQVGIYNAATKADEGTIENLKVQLSFTSIRAPITGRISMANVKVGNFARQADLNPLANAGLVADDHALAELRAGEDDRAGRDDRAGAELERWQWLPLRGRARRQRWLLADHGVVEDLAAVPDHRARIDHGRLGH